MRIAKWIGAPLAIVGVLMLLGAAFVVVRQTALINAGTATMGEVIALEPSSGSGGSTRYRPVVRFVTPQGQATIVGEVASSPPPHAVGDAVRVIYNPDRPSEALIDTFMERWFLPLMLGFLGSGTLGAGGIVLWRAGRARRVREELQRRGQRVRARVVEVQRGRGGWRVLCEWTNPLTRELRRFQSESLGFDPAPHLARGHVEVLIDPADPARYWVDTAFAGRAA